MLSSVEIKPDVYFVGALDWNAREFHGYTNERDLLVQSKNSSVHLSASDFVFK